MLIRHRAIIIWKGCSKINGGGGGAELNPELILNKHFRFPNEAFTGKQVPQTRILKHADGSVAKTFDEDIEGDDENMPSSSHDDTSSDSEVESTEYEGGSSGEDYVERSFQVLFIDAADIPEVV